MYMVNMCFRITTYCKISLAVLLLNHYIIIGTQISSCQKWFNLISLVCVLVRCIDTLIPSTVDIYFHSPQLIFSSSVFCILRDFMFTLYNRIKPTNRLERNIKSIFRGTFRKYKYGLAPLRCSVWCP